jgi:hypothetical protein
MINQAASVWRVILTKGQEIIVDSLSLVAYAAVSAS